VPNPDRSWHARADAAVAIAGSMIARMLFDHIVTRITQGRVLVYGAGRRAASPLELRRRSDQRGFRIVRLHPAGDDAGTPVERRCAAGRSLFAVTRNPIDEIVVAMDDRRRGFPIRFLECRLAGIDIEPRLSSARPARCA
jgi:hypothetical protein